MKFEEYDAMLVDLISDPDTALTKMDAIREALKTDLTSLESVTAEKGALEDRIRGLQQTNMDIYMRYVVNKGQETPEEKEAPTGQGVVDEFIEELFSTQD